MTYYIYGSINYANATARNNALSAINTTLSSYSVTNVATALPAGVNTSGTTALTISIEVSDAQVEAVRMSLLTAWTGQTRATTGHYISAVKRN